MRRPRGHRAPRRLRALTGAPTTPPHLRRRPGPEEKPLSHARASNSRRMAAEIPTPSQYQTSEVGHATSPPSPSSPPEAGPRAPRAHEPKGVDRATPARRVRGVDRARRVAARSPALARLESVEL